MPAEIHRFTAPDLEAHLPAFAGLLHACVHAGASVGFVLPFPLAEAEEFWRDAVLPPLRDDRRLLLVVHERGALAGTVQLLLDAPPTGRHRAEVAKLLVHPDRRRRGLARALMTGLEAQARRLDRSLLSLGVRGGDPAEMVYAALGYRTAGAIPGWCRDPASDRLDAKTIMYKRL